jgi:ribosomal protein S18 acetylase RimI-like enzyme
MNDSITITSLKDLDNEQLFTAFSEAFVDYEMQLNQHELFRMLKRRGYKAELSYGAFDQNRLVSFTLNGIGTFNGQRTAYDTGTGTVPDYRGKGLAGTVFSFAEKELKAASIQQYLLEVLQHNTTAVKLYQKLGFEITRSFNYFHQDAQQLKLDPAKLDLDKVMSIPLDLVEAFETGDFPSSWQNSLSAVKRSPEDFRVLGYHRQDLLLGSLILDPQTGDITQIAVHPEHRRQQIGTSLVAKALQINQHERIKLINADARDTGMTKFMESLGMPLQGKQYEMIKKF